MSRSNQAGQPERRADGEENVKGRKDNGMEEEAQKRVSRS